MNVLDGQMFGKISFNTTCVAEWVAECYQRKYFTHINLLFFSKTQHVSFLKKKTNFISWKD